MWGNFAGVVGKAISKVQEIQTELESQLDAAVNVEEGTNVIGVNKRPTSKDVNNEAPSSQAINREKETSYSKAIDGEKLENITTKISSSISVDSFYKSSKKDIKLNEDESQLSEISLDSKSPKVKPKGKSIIKSTRSDDSISNKFVSDITSNKDIDNEKAVLQQSHRIVAELENINEINNNKVIKMKEEFENEIFDLKNKHKIELEVEITNALEREKSDYLEELSKLRTFWSAEKDELSKQIKTIEKKNLVSIESIKKTYENKLLKLETEYKKEIDELMNKTSSQSSQHLASNSVVVESKHRLEDKLKLANSRISELEKSLKESRENLDVATKSSIDSSSLLVEIKQNSERQLLLANNKINELKQTLDFEIKSSADLAEIELQRTINQLQNLKDNVTELESANFKATQVLLEKSSIFKETQNNLEKQLFTSNNKIKELELLLLEFQEKSTEAIVKDDVSLPVKGQKLKIALEKVSELELLLIDSNNELLNEKKKNEMIESELVLSNEKVNSLNEKNKISNDKLNDINKELKILSLAKDSSDDQVKALQIELNTLELSLSKSKNELITHKDEIKEYQTQLTSSDDKLKASLYKISELEMSQKNSTEEEQLSNKKMELLEISIQNYKVEIEKEIQNKKKMEEQLESLEDQLDVSMTRIEKVESSLRSAHNNSKTEKEELNKQLLNFEEKNKLSTLEINRLNDLCIKLNNFEEENKLIQTELLNTKNKLIELEELSKNNNNNNNNNDNSNDEENKIMIELKNNLKLLEEKNENSLITIEKQSAIILELNQDIKKQSEIVSDRERSLESNAVKMSENHKILEQTLRKLSDLQDESKEKDNRLREMQTVSAGDGDMKKLIIKLQESVKEKHEQLAEFQNEGQILAKKQSDMEKSLRKKNVELKEKDKEIDGLKESKIQLNKAIEEMSELVRKHENESSISLKSLNAMQAVSQASSDKVSKIEIELNVKHDEIVNQKRALEISWAECNELKRSVTELKADRDDLRKQIGEGTSNMRETESSRRDIEQREAVLRATSKQLQESLQRQMQESSGREERLREEVNEMRKRWHDAITSRDSLASDLGSATAPLLRQISSLQEGIRTKTESWQVLESSLSERALRAESACEIAEHKKLILDEQLLNNKQQITSLSNRLNDALVNVQTNEDLISKCKRIESNYLEKIKELESKLSLESGQKHSLQSSLKELESRYKLDIQDSKDSYDSSSKKFDKERSNYEEEIKELRSQLINIQTKQQKEHDTIGRNVNNNNSDFDITMPVKSKSYSGLPGTLPSGEQSYAATERNLQQSHQRMEEYKALSVQLKQIEASRDALLDEVSYLSARNSQLEEQSSSVPKLSGDILLYRQQNELLLSLLGEKEEEVEATLADMKEVKSMYRLQMEELLNRITPICDTIDFSTPSDMKLTKPEVLTPVTTPVQNKQRFHFDDEFRDGN